MTDLIGKTISHYKILEALGQGGMGVVYKAEDRKLKRRVALKFLPPDLTRDQEANRRFIYEAQTASALDHQNICTIHEIDQSKDGRMFICMAYYQGETLKEKIARGPLPVDEAMEIALQIARGLSKAHEKEIIHRDIKPANIIVQEDGTVKIIDFGLSKLMSGQTVTKTGTTKGTVAYMSPEQAQGKRADQRADIWALGGILYQILTGKLPFPGESDPVALYCIVNEEPEPLTGFRDDIPGALIQIVEKALKKDIEQRYQSMDEITADLQQLQKSLENGTPLVLSSLRSPLSKYSRLKKTFLPAAAILLLVAAVFFLRPGWFRTTPGSASSTIAVTSFENQSGDPNLDYLQKAIPNLLITSLEQSGGLRVATWERMQDILKQMGKNEAGIIDNELGFKLCRKEGIETIVLGSFTKAGDVFATDVKVLDVKSKELLKSGGSRGKGIASILMKQIDELSAKISQVTGASGGVTETGQQAISKVTTTSIEAYNYFLRGREDFEKYYFNDARHFLEKAVLIDSLFATAYFYLALTHYQLRNIRTAKAAFVKAFTLSEKLSEKEKLYIQAYYAGTIKNNPEGKIQFLQQIIKRYPEEKRAHYRLAFGYRMKKLYNQAIFGFKKVLQLDPYFGLALNQLGYTYADIGDYGKAIEYFKQYAFVSPGDANPFDSMAELYLRMGKINQAIEKYQEALEVKPDFFGTFWKIGYLYALKQDYTEALKWIDQFIAVSPTSGLKAEGFWWKGFYHYWLGSIEQSFDDFRRATELADESGNEMWKAYSEWVKGLIYYDMNEFDLSRKYITGAYHFFDGYNPVVAAQTVTGYNLHVGLIDLKQGRIDLAKLKLSKIDSLLKLNPVEKDWIKYLHGFFNAEILLAENSLEKATAVCKSFSTLGAPPTMYTRMILPYNIPVYKDVSARIFVQSGQLDRAIAEYEGLINLDPDSKGLYLIHPKYYYRLGKLYQEKGLTAKAILRYEKFLHLWKDADKNLPELVDAKSRYAHLKGEIKK